MDRTTDEQWIYAEYKIAKEKSNESTQSCNTEAEFSAPDWGDKVDNGIGLSYQPARLHRLVGRYDSYAIVNFIPNAGTKNLAIGLEQ